MEMIPSSKGKESTVSVSIFTGIISLSLLSTFLLAGVFYSLPSNVVSQKDESKSRVFFSRFLPESWGFFTKPPNSPEYAVYSVKNDLVKSELAFPHSKPSNWYGFLRKHRAQGPEVALLTNQTGKEQWIDCRSVDEDCVLEASRTNPVVVKNDFSVKSLCGQLIIAETVPVEWSYRDSFDGWRKEIRAVHIESDCR